MWESEYDKYTINKSVKKIIQQSNYIEIRAAKNEVPIPDIDELSPEERTEARLITEEMAYTLVYKLIQRLEPEEQYIIRHSFGLPKQYTRHSWYKQKTRKEIAKELDLDPRDILWIREDVTKKLFGMLLESVEGR